nr:F0F1 ATP synthase subunit epsilon [Actinomadura citrea]
MKVGLVSPEREVWSGEAKMVVAQTIEGSLGILPGHAPVLGVLLDGSVVKIEPADGGAPVLAAVGSGFFSVAADEVSVLAEQVERDEEIDVDDAKRALDEALSAEAEDATPERRARARLRAAGVEV